MIDPVLASQMTSQGFRRELLLAHVAFYLSLLPRLLVKDVHSREVILGGLHIQSRRIQICLLFYFYSFNIVFEDKPSAVLTS